MLKDKKPLIFVTNDDGIHAKGLCELINGIRSLGEIVVIAPDSARSGMSSAISSLIPIRLTLEKKEEDLTIYKCTGTPVDCVKLGINEIMERKPDLVVSGINHGSNSSICVIYSGTVGAALEACILGVPSVAISLANHSLYNDFTQALKYGKWVAERVLENGLPPGRSLNLNVPAIREVKGLKICTQTKGYWAREFQIAKDPRGKPIYWLTGEFFNEEPENEQSDEWALSHGYAALVPLQIDMTAYPLLQALKEWECE
jgi:5'-nucleotidase